MKLNFLKSGDYLKAIEGDYWTTKTKRCELNQTYSLIEHAAREMGMVVNTPIKIHIVSKARKAQEWEATLLSHGEIKIRHLRSGNVWHG